MTLVALAAPEPDDSNDQTEHIRAALVDTLNALRLAEDAGRAAHAAQERLTAVMRHLEDRG